MEKVEPISDDELNAAAVELADWMMARVEDGTVSVDVLKRRLGFPMQFAQLINATIREQRIKHGVVDLPPAGVDVMREQLENYGGRPRVIEAVNQAFFRHRRALLGQPSE